MHTKTGLHIGGENTTDFLPEGSYRDSCISMNYSQSSGYLWAKCPLSEIHKNKDGIKYQNYNDTSLGLPAGYTGDISNCNGILKPGKC